MLHSLKEYLLIVVAQEARIWLEMARSGDGNTVESREKVPRSLLRRRKPLRFERNFHRQVRRNRKQAAVECSVVDSIKAQAIPWVGSVFHVNRPRNDVTCV